MRKKLSLAAALLPAPRLLFLDEPFEGIDAVASRQIKDLLHAFVARGGTIFLTSHILEIVERLSTHIGVIAKGKHRRAGTDRASCARAATGRSLEELFIELVGGDGAAPSRAGLDLSMIRILRAFAWMRWRVLLNSLERTGVARHARAPVDGRRADRPDHGAPDPGACPARALGAQRDRGLRCRVGVGYGCHVSGAAVRRARGHAARRDRSAGHPGVERANPVRLLLLPIPRAVLYVAQAAGALTDPWTLILLPPAVFLPLGLLAGGAPLTSAVALLAGLLLVLVVVGLSTLTASLAQLVLRDRRRGELVALVFIVVMPFLSILSNGILAKSATPKRQGVPVASAVTPARRAFQAAVLLLPSEQYVGAVRSQPGAAAGMGSLGLLALTAIAVHGLGILAFRRLLASPGIVSRRRQSRATRAGRRLPGLSPAASAVATAHLRLGVRTTRGRSALISPVMILVVLSVASMQASNVFGGLTRNGIGTTLIASLFSVMAILPLAMNQFAIDGPGLTLELLSPVSDDDLLKGKGVANVLLALGPALLSVGLAALFFRSGPVPLWISLVLGLVATHIAVAPAAAVASILFPRHVDLNSVGRASNAHGVATWIGLGGFAASIAPPLALVALAVLVLKRPWLAPALVLGWCLVAFGITSLLFRPVRGLLAKRRENLSLVVRH